MGCWVTAVVSWIMAVRHRRPDQTVADHLFSGMKILNGDNFTAQGQLWRRRYGWAVLGFFAVGGLTLATAVLAGR